MKSLLKLAVGATIAYAVANVLMKQRAMRDFLNPEDQPAPDTGAGAFVPTGAFTPTALVADTNSVGEGSGDDRVQIPDDGRVSSRPLNS